MFQDLKQGFITAPILAHYNLKLKKWIKTNFSDFVTVNMLLQMHNRVLKPVIYFSIKLISVECNYILYNKFFFTIVKKFEIWYPKLANATNQVKVYTDHRNLKYFMTTK